MKKILALALTFLFIIAAGCTPKSPSSQGTTEVQRPEKSNTGYFTLHRTALDELEKDIARLTPEDVYFRQTLKTLEYYDIDIAVYAEVSRENEKIALDEWRLNGTYKVGLFDAYGRLIKEYDTGVDVLMSAFGLVPVNMWLSGENLHMYGFVKSTDNRYFAGYININTGKYTPVKKFEH